MRQKQLPLVIVCDMLTYSNFKTKKMYSRFRNGNCSNIVGTHLPLYIRVCVGLLISQLGILHEMPCAERDVT